mmetsp:Transcript_106545/g.306397  ORF Transcript_106545/g.306397 Transcript_106545/m.306397 type:complete len:249 (+) Transcript_106545:909-1655(+)
MGHDPHGGGLQETSTCSRPLPVQRVEQIASAAALQDEGHRVRLVEVLMEVDDVGVLQGNVRAHLAELPKQVLGVARLQGRLADDLGGELLAAPRGVERLAAPDQAEGAFAEGASAEEAVAALELGAHHYFRPVRDLAVDVLHDRMHLRVALLAHEARPIRLQVVVVVVLFALPRQQAVGRAADPLGDAIVDFVICLRHRDTRLSRRNLGQVDVPVLPALPQNVRGVAVADDVLVLDHRWAVLQDQRLL